MATVDLKSHVTLKSANRMGTQDAAGTPVVKVGDKVSIPHLQCGGVVDSVTEQIVHIRVDDPSRTVTVLHDQCVAAS